MSKALLLKASAMLLVLLRCVKSNQEGSGCADSASMSSGAELPVDESSTYEGAIL